MTCLASTSSLHDHSLAQSTRDRRIGLRVRRGQQPPLVAQRALAGGLVDGVREELAARGDDKEGARAARLPHTP